MNMSRSPCPADSPFMNCTYDEVCSAPCTALPGARCLVDHCGACTPVHLNGIGRRVDCSTGNVLECPRGVEMVACLVNPCDSAVCTADPMAQCVASYCGECLALFVNSQGQHVNCETGEASACPPGLVENPATTEEACAMETCPAHPWALCLAKKCLWPNTPLECPYQFFDVRARPVQCTREKRGQCPRIEPPEGDECVTECMGDEDCEGDEKCCGTACGGWVCHDSDMDMEEPMQKPGTCPEPSMMDGGVCVDECNPQYGDAGCPRHWKCCNNGCGHVCTAPQEMPGECPMVPADEAGDECEQECASDIDCQTEEPGSKCCSHGCGMECMAPVRAEKPGTCPRPSMGVGGICAESCMGDQDCQGRGKCCSNGCGHSCMDPMEQPGECPHKPNDMMLMAMAMPQQACTNDSECSGRRSKCCAYGCGQICVEPVKDMDRPLSPCPSDRPFMNCTYDEVCSAPCTAVPSARCLVDHCGGCTPVYLTAVGHRMDCATGNVLECPSGYNMVTCLLDPCEAAMCNADPTARCISINCGDCRALFVNSQGLHVNCETGQASVCPAGLVENPATTEAACATETCPAHPWAKCLAKKCLWPNTPLECPYQFFDVRARPVQCTREKRGQCPRIEAPEFSVCVTECMGDEDCEGDEKCCGTACGGWVCHDPDMGMEEPMLKPGTCPEPSMMDGGICVDECNMQYGDAGCPRHWKCCNNGCGHVCTAPQEMPGQCPMLPPGDVGDECEQECASDSDCQMDEPGSKCCSHGCGMKCMAPIRAKKPGTCPMPPMGSGGICEESCMGDHDCPERSKCCSNGCGNTCMDPMEQPGECPHKPNDMMLMAMAQQACTDDSVCSGRRSKCCAYGCGQICVEPVKDEKPGMCPIVDPADFFGICVEACSSDRTCPGNTKCCDNGCGHACLEPTMMKPGMCPAAPPGLANNCMQQTQCSNDMECPGRKKCCEAEGCDGRICLAPAPRAGECPAVPDDVAGLCVEECSADSNCQRGEKCCSNGCGHVCRRPMSVQCEEDVLTDICEHDPCQHATCPSMPDAVCVLNKCGGCRPKFFMDAMEVDCAGQLFCNGLGVDQGQYEAGTVVDSSDGCNQCVCTGQRIWRCTEINCPMVIQVSITFNVSFDKIINNKARFIGILKKVLSTRFGLPANAMRDFSFRKGSVIVDFKVSSDGTEEIDLEEAVDMMKTEVTESRLSLEFDGEEIQAEPDSFKSNPYEATPPSTRPPKKDTVVYIVIGVIGGLVIIIVVISLIYCSAKSKKEKAKRKKSENLEFNEYHNGNDKKAFNA